MFNRKKKQAEAVNVLQEQVEKAVETIMVRVEDEVIESMYKVLNKEDAVKRLNDRIVQLMAEVQSLEATRDSAASKRKIEESEMKHLLRMKEEKNALEMERKEVAIQKEYQAKEMAMLTQYQDKCVSLLNEAKSDMQAIYKDIMKCLPNVNADIYRGLPEDVGVEIKKGT